MGALAFGIGSSESCMCWRRRPWCSASPSACASSFEGKLPAGVTAKDMILHLIGELGAAGGTGYAVEYAGSAIRACVEGRLTICNLSIEMGAKTGMVAPDDTTYDYMHGRDYAPKGAIWDGAVAHWRTLPTDADADFDREHTIDMAKVAPQITWGTSPEHVIAVDRADSRSRHRAGRDSARRWTAALDTWSRARQADRGHAGRLGVHRLLHQQPHLRSARRRRDREGPQGAARARLGRARIRARQARGRGRGLDRVFKDAGFEWREPGCSMCSPPTASACRRASAASRPPTATSSGARGRARAPISPARRWPRPRPITGAIADVRKHLRKSHGQIHHGRRRRRAPDARERRHRPHHPHRAAGQQRRRRGLGPYCFEDPLPPDGTENPDFVLNQPPYRGAPISWPARISAAARRARPRCGRWPAWASRR